MSRKENRKKIKVIALMSAAAVSFGCAAGMPALSLGVQAAAGPAYESKWTVQYPFLTLLKSSLLNPYTDSNGIYEQLKQGIKYQTVSETDIMQLLQEGYRIPADVLQRLYAEGWISGYLYKTVSGQPFTAADFKDVFDVSYYVSANPVIAAAVQNGTLPGDEMSLFLNYLTCGIPAGLNGSSSFSFAYFEAHYPQIAKALGNDKMAEAAYYILNKNSQHLKGNA